MTQATGTGTRRYANVRVLGTRRSRLARFWKPGAATLAVPFILWSGVASAAWPWQSQAETDAAWCKGFIAAGLGSQQVMDGARTELWLAWNYTISQGVAGPVEDIAAFQQGAARFSADMTSDQVRDVLEEAGNGCGLNRSGYAVTGW